MINYESINKRLGFDFLKCLGESNWDDTPEKSVVRLLTEEEKKFVEKDLSEKVRKERRHL